MKELNEGDIQGILKKAKELKDSKSSNDFIHFQITFPTCLPPTKLTVHC
jgi:hypothetical protein